MAEDKETSPGMPGADPLAVHRALSADSAEARDYLRHQSEVAERQKRLLDLQIEDLTREDSVRHWSLRVRHISDVLKLGIELAAAAIILAIAIFIGAAVWNAAHDNGLVIEAFNVPADFSANGLTGDVVATQVQDRLAWMQAHTDTIRLSNAYRRDFGDDIKVQIPNTGVSVAEFYRYLGNWLGHQTHITGEIWRTRHGLALSIRSGQDAAANFQGSEDDLNALVTKAAEQIYWQTQPYRYVAFLGQHGRRPQSMKLMQALVEHGAAEDRPWALSRLGTEAIVQGDVLREIQLQSRAAALGPNLPHIWSNLASAEALIGHERDMLVHLRRALALLKDPVSAKQLAQVAVNADIAADGANIDETFGDFRAAIALEEPLEKMPVYSRSDLSARLMRSADLALDHDIAGSERTDRDSEEQSLKGFSDAGFLPLFPPLPVFERAAARGDWKAALEDMQALLRTPVASSPASPALKVWLWPKLALAQAKLGDIAAARTSIAHSPEDCAFCNRVRGDVEALAGNWRDAERWFAASNALSDGPFADTDWGAMLMRKGDLDSAIAKFEQAHAKGPHFADPLEMWGEVLIAKNRSDLAVAKFEEAAKYAPNWKRLHQKWGEALSYVGRKDEAAKQFALARTLQ